MQQLVTALQLRLCRWLLALDYPPQTSLPASALHFPDACKEGNTQSHARLNLPETTMTCRAQACAD